MNDEKPDPPVTRPRGRPRVDDPLTSITVRVPMSVHDEICRLAIKRDEHVSSIVRNLIVLRLPR